MNETPVTVVGNIASEVTARRVGVEHHLLVGFRIASSERRWDKASGSWVDGDRFTAWVTCWRRLGEHVRGSLVKGDPVMVTGRLSVREYEVNGERRWSTDLAATAVGPDLARCTAQVTRQRLSAIEPERAEALAAAVAGDAAPDEEGCPEGPASPAARFHSGAGDSSAGDSGAGGSGAGDDRSPVTVAFAAPRRAHEQDTEGGEEPGEDPAPGLSAIA